MSVQLPAVPIPEPVFLSDTFVRGLLEEGVVQVTPFVPNAVLRLDGSARAALADWDMAARLELAGEAPPVQWPALEWAAVQYYRACQLLVCRDAPAEAVTQVFAQSCPVPADAAAAFSVDLIFRFLPELAQRAQQLAPGDALVGELQRWTAAWPLSSVGIALEDKDPRPAIDALIASPPLWRLYLDRVAARHATDRWRDPRVAAGLRADLGAYPELAPALASALDRAAPATIPAPFP